MLKLYKYIYYRLYTWNLKTWGSNDGPEFNASLGISMLMANHIAIILFFINDILIYKSYTIHYLNVPKFILIGIMVLLIAITFFWFVHKKRYLKIIKKHENESKEVRRKNTIKVWIFVLLSIFLLISLPILGRYLK